MSDKLPVDDDFMSLALKRFEASKEAWQKIREAWKHDTRMVKVVGGQWDAEVAARRENAGKPALEFNEEHTYVSQIVNQARQDRPQPKVTAGDDEATAEAAEFLESRLRHIQCASQADVAYDHAIDGAATGGIGFFRIEKEYIDQASPRKGKRPSSIQEPRIKRILDPMTQYPDAGVLEPDFSDAKYWFDRGWIDRDAYRKQYKQEPIDFEDDAPPDWVKHDQVCIARYWTVEESERSYVWLSDGAEGYRDELEEIDENLVENERPVTERKIECHIIDGEKRLKTTAWEGDWIPYIVVLGAEVAIDGERHFISAVRFAHGAQQLKNAYKSGIANLLQLASTAPWLGPRGMFKDRRWSDANEQNYATLEWEPVYDKNNQLINAQPTRNTFEAPIQSLAASSVAASDDIRRAVGYSDAVLQPSRSDLSGIAIQRRGEQQSLTNYHFQDNLVRAQWHAARVILDLDMKLADTPRVMKGRKASGDTYSMPVTLANDDGVAPEVPGYEGKPHLRFDRGRFDLEVVSGPSYDSKREEERDTLIDILKADPSAYPLYLDVLFKLMGYQELEERAKLALPPQIQQAIAAKQQGIPPQAQAALIQLQGQNQKLMQAVQQLMQMIQTKQIETKGKLDIEKLKLIRELMVQQAQHSHEAGISMMGERTDAVEHLLSMLHESELAPDPNAPQQQPQQQAA